MTEWTAKELRQIPRWWDRAHLKDRASLELQGKQHMRLLLAAYEAEHARAERLAQGLQDIASDCDRCNDCTHMTMARAALAEPGHERR